MARIAFSPDSAGSGFHGLVLAYTRTVPRAIIRVALIGGGIFVAASYVTQLAHRGLFEDSASSASSIALPC